MVILKAYKYRLCPTQHQSEMFFQWAGSCRYVYNLGLEHRALNWNQFRISLSYGKQCKELTQLKKEEEVQWLNDVPSQCLQQSLRMLDISFQNFFNKIASYPTFKVKGARDSFRFPQPQQFLISHQGKKGYVDIPKAGKVKFICTRPRAFEGRPCSLTITRDVDQWYVSIQCEVEVEDILVIPEEDVGIDWGVAHTLTTSDGIHYDLPISRMKEIEARIQCLQKKLSIQKKFGSNWRKTRGQIAKLYRKMRRIKEEFIQKVTTQIVRSRGGIGVEDLKVKNMTGAASGTLEEPGNHVAQKAGLNRSILRSSPGKIIEVLKYKSEWNKRLFVKVRPQFSSLECSKCGHIDAKNRKNQAEFECVQCRYKDHADINASRVIKKRMQSSPPQELRDVPVEKAA